MTQSAWTSDPGPQHPDGEEPPASIELLKLALDQHRANVVNYWTRSGLYLLVTGGLLSVFISSTNRSSVRLSVPVLGIIIAVMWYWTVKATLHWATYWRLEVAVIDKRIDPYQMFHRAQQIIRDGGFRIHPDLVSTWVPLVVAAGWITLTITWVCTKL